MNETPPITGAGCKSLRIILADDSPDFLRSAGSFLRSLAYVDLVGTASDGLAALELADRVDPDVILLDLQMPGMDGLSATRCLRAQGSTAHIVMLTVHDAVRVRQACFQAGVDGFVPKETLHTELIPLLRRLTDGVDRAGCFGEADPRGSHRVNQPGVNDPVHHQYQGLSPEKEA